MPRFALVVMPLALSLGLAACGGSTQGTTAPPGDDTGTPGDDGALPETGDDAAMMPEVDNGAPSNVYPAPHPALPQLVNPAHGSVLETPKVKLFFFPSYPFETQLKDFAQTVGTSAYWTAAVSEYGVGAMQYVDATELTGETAPTTITSDEVDAYVNGKIASGAWGTPDPAVVYTIFYPQGTTISQAGGPLGTQTSCKDFGGYHSDTAVAVGGVTKNFAYAVIPTCATFGALTGIDGVTGALSHEWAEASTDPFPSTNNGADSAFSSVDNDHVIWNLLGGAENGDLCAQRDEAFFKPAGYAYTVQATWSNKAAKAGGDPCAPKPTGVYFNAIPVMNDKVTLDLSAFGGGKVPTKGTKIAQGASQTVEVDLFSDGDTHGAWSVSAIDVLAQFTGGKPTLQFAWDRTTGQNGEKLHLTITVVGASSFGKAHPYMLVSQLAGKRQLYPALVSE